MIGASLLLWALAADGGISRWEGFLLVLFGVLGGLLAFGLVGLFIGPIVLAVAWAVWREWAAHLDDAASEETS